MNGKRVTKAAIDKALADPVTDALSKHGITLDELARRLRRDLDRKETKILKVKGAVFDWAEYLEREAARMQGKDQSAPAAEKPYRVLASSAEETVIAIDVDSVGTQVEAREDAQKLLDMYPVETKKIQLDEGTLSAILNGLPAGVGEAVRAELGRIVSEKRD